MDDACVGKKGSGSRNVGTDENDDGAMCHALFMYCYVVSCLLCVAHVYYMNVYYYYPVIFFPFVLLRSLMKSPPTFVRVYHTSHVIFLDFSG